jgi:hypothetical protein
MTDHGNLRATWLFVALKGADGGIKEIACCWRRIPDSLK